MSRRGEGIETIGWTLHATVPVCETRGAPEGMASRDLALAHIPCLLRAPVQNLFKLNSRAVGAGDVVNYAKVLPQPARAFERGIAALADRHGCFAVFIGEVHDPNAAFHF